MLKLFRRSERLASLLIVASLALACSGSDEPSATETIWTEATELRVKDTTRPDARPAFHHDLIGVWRTTTFERGAWVDLIWVMGHRRAWHVVTAYADEQLTIPLVRWDVVREYQLGQASNVSPHARELTWTDLSSSLVAYVDAPELFASIGIDDCRLTPGVRRDLSVDNCGAPLFPYRDCPLLDFVELDGEMMTFGDPQQGDRCELRPTAREAWSFQREPLSPELWRRLFEH